jgi:hypothetical protein
MSAQQSQPLALRTVHQMWTLFIISTNRSYNSSYNSSHDKLELSNLRIPASESPGSRKKNSNKLQKKHVSSFTRKLLTRANN